MDKEEASKEAWLSAKCAAPGAPRAWLMSVCVYGACGQQPMSMSERICVMLYDRYEINDRHSLVCRQCFRFVCMPDSNNTMTHRFLLLLIRCHISQDGSIISYTYFSCDSSVTVLAIIVLHSF